MADNGDSRMNSELDVSVIVPAFNERESLALLIPACVSVMEKLAGRFEIVVVDDGSRDGTGDYVAELSEIDSRLVLVRLARNFGQTAAMMAGIDNARGEIIVPIDADLQNDPADIPRLLAKLDEGYDVVSGWRHDRKDAAIRRNLMSRCANWLISTISGVRLHDYGCSLKAYRRSVIGHIRLYGEMHRFIPIYAAWYGARITEIDVAHRPRRFGNSHYGLVRIFKVVLDLIVVLFLDRWLDKPIYLFGGFGLLWLAISFLGFGEVIYLKLGRHVSMILTPLPTLVAITFMMGVMSILIGLLAEIVVRVYYEQHSKPTYFVREARKIG